VQGKAEHVTAADRLALLQEFYRDRLRLAQDHLASAQRVGQYHFNNTYQYIIAREETHLQWVADAIAKLGASPPEAPPAEPGPATETDAIGQDLKRQRDFVERWRPRVTGMTNARDQKMLEVILGEALEHAQFLADAQAGRTDLLGRSATGAGERGTVLANRWIE
jgi:bacterioferritin (cytochrome b1)